MKKSYLNSPPSIRQSVELSALAKWSTPVNASVALCKPKENALKHFRVLIVFLLMGLSAISQAQIISPEGLYRILNVNSGQALEIGAGSVANGAAARQWTFYQYAHQLWFALRDPSTNYYKFVNRNSSLVLEVANNGLYDGDLVQQNPDNGSLAQRWEILPVPGTSGASARYNIRNVNSGKVLEIGGAATNDGATANQWFLLAPNQYYTQEHQQWSFQSFAQIYGETDPAREYGGVFRLYNAFSNKYLSLGPNILLSSGAPVGTYATNDATNSDWVIIFDQLGATASTTTYNIINRESFLSLNPVNNSTAPGTGLEQNAFGFSGQTKWTIETIGANHLVRISPASNSNLYVGVTSTSNTVNGQQATINTLSANPQTQEWELQFVGRHRGVATTPVAQPMGQPAYTLSPNPAVNEVVIQSTALASEKSINATKGITGILVYDTYGKLRLEQPNTENSAIHLRVDKLPDGLYTVHLLNGKGVVDRQMLQIKR